MEARRMPAQEGPLGDVYIRRDQIPIHRLPVQYIQKVVYDWTTENCDEASFG